MADNQNNNSQERTEKPTQRKLDKAREEGKTVTSKEMYVLSSIVLMLALFYFLASNYAQILNSWKNLFFLLETVKYGISPVAALKDASYKTLIFIVIIGIPGLVITALTQLFVGGITFSFKAVSWKNSKFNPIEWMKRTFSVKGLVELSKSILKVILLFGVGAFFLYNETSKLIQLSTETFEHAVETAASFFPLLIIFLIIVLLLIGILDWSWQKYSFIKSLRMNRQDLKDESKETEGSPEVKAKIRRLQYETVKKAVKQAESLENVSDASAIIVNPTHFAVALKYDVGEVGAPKVLAMGRGKIAEKIIEKGEEVDIFIYRHKLLARALFFTSEIGQEISDKLYTAVAIALAYIYKVNKGEDIIEPDIELPNELIFNEDGTTNEKKSK